MFPPTLKRNTEGLTLKAFSCRLVLLSFKITSKLMGFALIRPGLLLKSSCCRI